MSALVAREPLGSMRLCGITLFAALLVGSIFVAAPRARAHTACSAVETKLYISVEGADRRVDVFCGASATPTTTMKGGMAPLIGAVAYDGAGNVYVTEFDNQPNDNGTLLKYNSRGKLIGQVGSLPNLQGLFIDRTRGIVYASTPRFKTVPFDNRGTVVAVWSSRVTAIVGQSPRIDRQIDFPTGSTLVGVDQAGRLIYTNRLSQTVGILDPSSRRVVASVRLRANATTLGPGDALYAVDALGNVRRLGLRTLKSKLLFRDTLSRAPARLDVIAVSGDGTTYIVNEDSARVEVFRRNSGKAVAIIQGLEQVDGILFDRRNRAYVAAHYIPNVPPGGAILVYAADGNHLVRTYRTPMGFEGLAMSP